MRPVSQPVSTAALRPASSLNRPVPSNASAFRPSPKPATQQTQGSFVRPEPTYHNASFSERNSTTRTIRRLTI